MPSVFQNKVAPSLRSQVNPSSAEGDDPNLQIDPTGADSASGVPQPQAGALTNDQSANRFAPAPQVTAPQAPAPQPAPAKPALAMDRGDMEQQPSDAAMAGVKAGPASPAPAPTPAAVQGPVASTASNPYQQEVEKYRELSGKVSDSNARIDTINKAKEDALTAPVSRGRRWGSIAAGILTGITTKNPMAGINEAREIRLAPAREANAVRDIELGNEQTKNKNLTEQITAEKALLQGYAPKPASGMMPDPNNPGQYVTGVYDEAAPKRGEQPTMTPVLNSAVRGMGVKEGKPMSGQQLLDYLNNSQDAAERGLVMKMPPVNPQSLYTPQTDVNGKITGALPRMMLQGEQRLYKQNGDGSWSSTLMDRTGQVVAQIDRMPGLPSDLLPQYHNETEFKTVMDSPGHEAIIPVQAPSVTGKGAAPGVAAGPGGLPAPKVGPAVAGGLSKAGEDLALGKPKLEEAAQTMKSGRHYIDTSQYSGPVRAAIEKEANQAGIQTVNTKQADSLRQLDEARDNLNFMWSELESKLPKDATGRVLLGPANRLKALFQIDPTLAAAGTFRSAGISLSRAVGGAEGLKITKELIAAAQENDIPKATDTCATALKRKEDMEAFLENIEKATLERQRNPGAKAAPRAGDTPAAPAVSDKVKALIQKHAAK